MTFFDTRPRIPTKTIAAAAALTCGALLCGLATSTATLARPAIPKGCPYKSLYRNTGNIRVHLSAPTHHPKAETNPNKGNFPITVTARAPGGKPISGGYVFYQFLFGGQVVSCQYVGPLPASCSGRGPLAHPYLVHGVFHDCLDFPPRAVGIPLTLRVVVQTNHPTATRNLDWAVTVRR